MAESKKKEDHLSPRKPSRRVLRAYPRGGLLAARFSRHLKTLRTRKAGLKSDADFHAASVFKCGKRP